jgi:phosphinothricin acetyltransferase
MDKELPVNIGSGQDLPAVGQTIIVRDAADHDMAGVQAIYAFQVLHGLATFEETPPSTNELLSRRASVLGLGLPYLVA